jgi:hypothetical protein
MNPSVALQVRVPDIPDPLAQYGRYLSLKDMVDQRRYREQQLRMQQVKIGAELEEQQQARNLNQLFARSTEPNPQEILRVGGPKAIPILREQRQAETARLQQEEAQRKTEQQKQEEMFNARTALLQVKDPAQRAAMHQQYTQDFVRKGYITAEQALEPIEDEAGMEREYLRLYGPDKFQALKTARSTETRAVEAREEQKKLHALQTSKAQLEQAIATAPTVGNQEQYTAWRGSLPPEIAARTPAKYSPVAVQMVERMGLTAEQRQPSTAGDWVRIAVDPASTPEEQAQADKALSRLASQAKSGAPQMILSADQKVGNEAKLRDDYRQESKNYLTLRDAFGKIQGAAQSKTGPGDISLIFGYMKMLDPGSTVREGEFATAQNAGSIPQRVQAMYNKALNGERLDPTIRDQFVEESAKIYRQAEADQGKIRNIYGGIAARSNLDPENVVVDYSPGVVPPGTPAAKQAAPQGGGTARRVPLSEVMPGVVQPAAPPVGTIKNGYRFNGGDPAVKENWQKVK